MQLFNDRYRGVLRVPDSAQELNAGIIKAAETGKLRIQFRRSAFEWLEEGYRRECGRRRRGWLTKKSPCGVDRTKRVHGGNTKKSEEQEEKNSGHTSGAKRKGATCRAPDVS